MIDKLFRQSFVYGVTTILSRGTLVIALLVLPFLLAPRDYGALSMITTISALVDRLVPLEITQGFARLFVDAEDAEKQAYSSTAWLFTMGMLLLFLASTIIFGDFFCKIVLGDLTYITAFHVGLLFIAFNTLFYFLQHQFRWSFRTRDYAILSLVFSVLTLVLSLVLGAVSEAPLEGVLVGQCIGAAIAIALGTWRLRHSLRLRLDRKKLAAMLRLSVPIVPASLASYFSTYGGRLILNGATSLEELGIYSFASQIAGIALLLAAGFQAAMGPFVLAHHKDPEMPRMAAQLFEGFVATALCFCLVLGLFSPEAIRYFGNPAYADSGGLVLLLAFTTVVAQMPIFSPGFLVAKKPGMQMIVSVIGAMVALGANFLLIPLFGMYGAAVAGLFSALFFVALWFVLSERYYPVPIRWVPVGAVAIMALVAGLAALLVPFPGVAVALAAKTAVVAAIAGLALRLRLLPVNRAAAGVARLLQDLRARSRSAR